MYKCTCKTKYELTNKHYEFIGTECEKKGIVSTVAICPGCHRARIVGAESDWDEMVNEPCSMMFGFDIDPESQNYWDAGVLAFVGKRVE
jgi:hypothetical protein